MQSPSDKPLHDDYRPAYKGVVLFTLSLVYALNFIDRQILVILQEPIRAEMGLSDTQLGLLSGFSFAIIYVSAGIPIAYWADRLNRRNILAASLAAWSAMTALSGLAQTYLQLLMARVGVGLGEAGGSPPAHSIISDYFPPAQRATALSLYSSGVYVGILCGYAFGGVLAELVGWRLTFVYLGVPGILLAFVLLLIIKEPQRGRWDSTATSHKASGFNEALSILRARRSFWYVALGCASTTFIAFGNGNFLPSFLIRNHGFSVAQVGLVLSISAGLAGAIGAISGGILADRLGKRDMRWYVWVPLIGMTLATPPYFYVLLGENVVAIVAVIFFLNTVNSLYLGPSIAICHAMVPPGMRALTSATLFFIMNVIGLGLGPLFTGLASDLLEPVAGSDNLRFAMLMTACMGPVAMLMFYLGSRHLIADLKIAGHPAVSRSPQ